MGKMYVQGLYMQDEKVKTVQGVPNKLKHLTSELTLIVVYYHNIKFKDFIWFDDYLVKKGERLCHSNQRTLP